MARGLDAGRNSSGRAWRNNIAILLCRSPFMISRHSPSGFLGECRHADDIRADGDITGAVLPGGERQGRAPGLSIYHRTLRPLHRSGRSEEHTSELQSLMRISYAVFCLKKKNTYNTKF